MSRRSIIICLAALAAMLLFITIGVAVLYSGTGTKRVEYKVADNSQFLLLPAVPTDALAVCCFSEPSSVLSGVVSSNGFAKSLLSSGVSLDNMVVSLHFAELPLFPEVGCSVASVLQSLNREFIFSSCC